MAGQVKVAVVSGAISSSGTGTADFTKAGFGTPKACIVLLSFDIADDTSVVTEGKASIGFSDFTNHRCITHQDEDASAKVDSDARKSNTKTYVLLNVAAAVDIDGTASAITDGVRLTNTTNALASAVFATVIMFGGADLQISLDSITLGNGTNLTTVVTTGIPQDLVFFIGTDISGEDSSSSGINNSFGVVDISNDQTTIVNRCMGWTSDHNNNVGSPASIIRNDRCLKVLTEAAADDWGVELTAATPTSYTVTTRDVSPGAGMEVYALALNLDDRGSKVGSVDSPISGATWTPSVALGFTPQYVGLGLTHATVEGIIESDADAGGLGISSNTGAGEETFHGWYNEDASAAANTNNNFRSRTIDFRNDDVTVIVHDHSHSSFNNGDWTYTINGENEDTARKWFYWAVQEAAAEAPVSQAVGVSYEGLGVVSQTELVPHEALGRAAAADVIPHEAAGLLAATVQPSHEAVAELSQTEPVSYEALGQVAQTETPAYEAEGFVAATQAVPHEAAGTVVSIAQVTHEALAELLQGKVVAWESLIDLSAGEVVAFEALGVVTETVAVVHEAAGTVVVTAQVVHEALAELAAQQAVAYEAGAELLAQQAVVHEALVELLQTQVIFHEVLAELKVSDVVGYESLAELLQSQAVPHEATGLAVGTVVVVHEAAGTVVRIVVVPHEAAGRLAATVQPFHEAYVGLSAVQTVSIESLFALGVTAQPFHEALAELLQAQTVRYEAAGPVSQTVVVFHEAVVVAGAVAQSVVVSYEAGVDVLATVPVFWEAAGRQFIGVDLKKLALLTPELDSVILKLPKLTDVKHS